ncbi:Uncharacterized protein Rs2_11422 [Raphanus sativus]|uniref:Uncharacterized protein LOC108846738 n=1 Tax=Raphanus sativus TaxID=3726 RepID=A0A6J0MV03_RAPSA|nr:uncharacterized protein LOC108846738 [Raphanus sativus]KAJ4907764.1 Uncharacterized protein Rs2_11422 [Raphanus sativus]
MDETRKTQDESGKDTTEKEMQTPVIISGGDDNEDEYTPDDIMQLVESSSSPTTTSIEGANFRGDESFRVRFIDDPYEIPVAVQSSSGYITINVNEESCGPSFSDSDASAMASVDASGLFGGCCCLGFDGEKGGAWGANSVGASECEWDDDLLARFLGEDSV